MTRNLMQRVDDVANHPKFAAIVARLERGEGIGDADPTDVVAAIAREGLADLPLVKSRPIRPVLREAASEPAIATLFPRASRPQRLAIAAGLLQALDFWDASHEAAQEADDLGESTCSPYWHAIAHRREPDPGNASYWFRRVGRHPVLKTLGDVVAAMTPPSGGPPAHLVKNGAFDPSAFLTLCGSAREGSAAYTYAVAVQRAEMLLLLDATLAGV